MVAVTAVVTIATLLLSASARAADAHEGMLQCGSVLTADTRLEHDLGPCPGDGLVIDAAHVTLDCDGHRVTGVGAGSGTGVTVAGRHSVTIRDCEVRSFDVGIVLVETLGSRLERNTVSTTTTGYQLVRSTGNTLKDNDARDTLFAGFRLDDATANRLADNAVKRTRFGFLLNDASLGNLLEDNRAREVEVGFELRGADGNLLEDNEVTVASRRGFDLFFGNSPVTGNTLEGNAAVKGGGAGFLLFDGVIGNVLEENVARDNVGVGFELFDNTNFNLLRENEACDNGPPDAFQEAGLDNTFQDNDFCITEGI